MKKKFIILIVVLIIATGIVCGILFFGNGKTEAPETVEEDTWSLDYIDVIKCDTLDELKEYVKDKPMLVQDSDDPNFYSVGAIYLGDASVTTFQQTKEDGSFSRVDGMYEIELKDKSSDEVRTRISYFKAGVIELFDLENSISHSIYASEGYEIDEESPESYEALLNGEAEFGMTLLDEDNTVWVAEAYVDKKNVIKFSFSHIYDTEEYDLGDPHVALIEE